MENFGYPINDVSGDQSLLWAVNNLIQTSHEYKSISTDGDESYELRMQMVESALYLIDLVESTIER